jgi:hypothetical protein
MNSIAIRWLEIIAEATQGLELELVYVGGATLELYLEPVPFDMRITEDIDGVVEISSLSEYYALGKKLRSIGFTEDTTPGAPLCRWLYQNIVVDIMPTDAGILGFTNRWYKPGIAQALRHRLPSRREILIFSVPYLLASKIEAFSNRGNKDYYASKDLEDIISLLDGAAQLPQAILQAEEQVSIFIQEWLRNFAQLSGVQDIIAGHLSRAANPNLEVRSKELIRIIHQLSADGGNR